MIETGISLTHQEQLQVAWNEFLAGRRGLAERMCAVVAGQQPAEGYAWFFLGMCARQAGRNEEAVGYFERAVTLPGVPKFLYELGEAYRSVGRFDAAADAYSRLLAIDPMSASAITALHVTLADVARGGTASDNSSCKISFLIASRNDGFGGDPMSRLAVVLRRLIDVATDFEVVVADWGSDVPIAEVVSERVPHAGKIRCIHIPKAVTQRLGTGFSEVHALNVAARVSRGHFLARIDQDTLVGDRAAGWISSELTINDSRVYFSLRRDLNVSDSRPVAAAPIFQDTPIDFPWYFTAAVGILLAPRSAWHATGGYDESLIFRNQMEHDFCLRMARGSDLINLGVVTSCDFYHLWHPRQDHLPANPVRSFAEVARDVAERPIRNDAHWGLSQFSDQLHESVI